MACNDQYITLEQLYNILNNVNTSSAGVPKGARLTVGLSTYNTYFDSTGLGGGIWDGWAVSNGKNGTTNRLGKFCVYHDPSDSDFNVVDKTGGQKTNTLTTSELPAHTHSHGLASHTHTVTDGGHTHSVTEDTQLEAIVFSTSGGGTYTVNSSGYAVTLNKQQLRIEDSVAPTNPKTIEIYVPTVNLQAYAGLTSGTQATAISGSGSITVPAHSHTASLSHAHNHSVSSASSSITINANNTDLGSGTTSSTGLGQSFTNIPPFIVEVPVEKIV